MAEETKICKYCQSEIHKNAKVCPICKRRQSNKVVIIIAVIVVLGLIGSAAKRKQSNNTFKIDNSNATTSTETVTTDTNVEDVSTSVEEKNEGVVTVGGSFEDNGLKFTVNSAEIDYRFKDKYGLHKLDDGLVYLKVDFTFENTGDGRDRYVSIYDFDCYANNTACKQEYISDVTGDFINANISSGRNISFTTLYIIPADAETIELEYTSNIWTAEKVIVKIK